MEGKSQELKKQLLDLAYLSSATALLHWDLETKMPPRAAAARGAEIALLAGLIHEKFVSPEFEALVTGLMAEAEAGKLSEEDARIVRETFRDFSREKKLPKAFVEELARVTSEAHYVWVEARKKADFAHFLPMLSRIIALKRKEADLIGYKDSPYDALLDGFEKGSTIKKLSPMFDELKQFLAPFIKKLMQAPTQPRPELLNGRFDQEKQGAFGLAVVKKMGYDLDAGRIDESAHPFTIGLHPLDVRITTHFHDDNLSSLSSTVHEAGHALYDQGLDARYFGTPLGEALSLGIHESQSRLWENIIGKGLPFWKYWYPRLQETFPKPFAAIALEDFYRAKNAVQLSLIRIEADEVTYNLHIVIRFEIEKALIEGSLAPEQLPNVWNEKVKQYLGITVPNDAVGVLQDVHWSQGMFGYFPTYTLGNLYSAQFYATAKRDLPRLEDEIAKGEYGHLLDWLRKNIHRHGRRYDQDELVKRVTGEALTARYFIDYLKAKYEAIYKA